MIFVLFALMNECGVDESCVHRSTCKGSGRSGGHCCGGGLRRGGIPIDGIGMKRRDDGRGLSGSRRGGEVAIDCGNRGSGLDVCRSRGVTTDRSGSSCSSGNDGRETSTGILIGIKSSTAILVGFVNLWKEDIGHCFR